MSRECAGRQHFTRYGCTCRPYQVRGIALQQVPPAESNWIRRPSNLAGSVANRRVELREAVSVCLKHGNPHSLVTQFTTMKRQACLLSLLMIVGLVAALVTYLRQKPSHVEDWAISEARAHLDPSLFRRDQPRIARMFPWRNQIVVESDRYYVVDPENATATPMSVPGTETVIGSSLAQLGADRGLALCRSKQGLTLHQHDGTGWAIHPLPPEMQASQGSPHLLADSSSVVLLDGKHCYWFRNGAWVSVRLQERPRTMQDDFNAMAHLLLVGDTLYRGLDAGEWGGALLKLHLASGKWSLADSARQHRLPVRDLKVDPKGNVWVVEGLAHLSLVEGCVRYSDGKSWTTFAACTHRDNTNWPLEASAMDGIAFDEAGYPYLLAEDLGVVHHDGKSWRHLTPGWPSNQYVAAFHAISPDRFAIGMLDAGVLLWDVGTNHVKRVNLREPKAEGLGPGAGAAHRVRLR